MRRPLVTVAAAALLASMVLLLPGSGAVRPAHGLSYSKLNKIQRRILSGFATSELNPAATTAAVSSAGCVVQIVTMWRTTHATWRTSW